MTANLTCPKCGSRYTYTLQDGTKVCRKCGARTPRIEADRS